MRIPLDGRRAGPREAEGAEGTDREVASCDRDRAFGRPLRSSLRHAWAMASHGMAGRCSLSHHSTTDAAPDRTLQNVNVYKHIGVLAPY